MEVVLARSLVVESRGGVVEPMFGKQVLPAEPIHQGTPLTLNPESTTVCRLAKLFELHWTMLLCLQV